MSDLSLSGPNPSDPAACQEAVEEELAAFNAWFSAAQQDGGLGNAPLIPPELALLRTYLVARVSGRFSPPDWKGTPVPSGGASDPSG